MVPHSDQQASADVHTTVGPWRSPHPGRRPRAWDLAVTPGLLAFVGSARIREQPHRAYRLLRKAGPVHRSPFGFWVATGHAECDAVLRHPAFAVEEAKADLNLLRIGPLQRLLGRTDAYRPGPFLEISPDLMLFRDPPDHTRLRRLVNRAFTPARVSRLKGRIAEITEELLAGRAEHGPFDLAEALAYPLPARVICELMGLPPDDAEVIARHGKDLAVGLDPIPTRDQLTQADAAVVALRQYLAGPIQERRRRPTDDLLSALVAQSEDGDALSADELVATVVLILVAGHETTANLLTGATVLLDGEPALRRRLAEDPELAAPLVEELLRLEPPVQLTQRFAVEAVVLGGHTIPAGSLITLLLAAANRDPAVFTEPDRIRLDRGANPHLAFGAGAHFCLGAALARLEARIALVALARAMPDLRVIRPLPRRRSSLTIRGLPTLPVDPGPRSRSGAHRPLVHDPAPA